MDTLATGGRATPIFREHLMTRFDVMTALTTVTSLVLANPQFVPTHASRAIR
jgi:hypothetical protein